MSLFPRKLEHRCGKITGTSLALAVWITSAQAEWYSQEEAIMGTSVYVELWADSDKLAKPLIDNVMAEMRRIDASMSPFLPASELSQLNTHGDKAPFALTPELFSVIETSIRFSELSDGAFDVTFASVGHRYDYRKKIKPSDSEIEQTRTLIDYRHLRLNPALHTVFYEKPGMKVDLGGIAKGYAVDLGVNLLKRKGVQHAIVTAGGDSRILGDRRGRLWMVGIKNPRGKGHAITLPVEDIAVSTSGDYERYFEAEGKRYHHILNPKTGKSASGVESVTIMGDDALTTDALSTTVFVLGVYKGLALVNRLRTVSAVIIDDVGNVHYSDDLMTPE